MWLSSEWKADSLLFLGWWCWFVFFSYALVSWCFPERSEVGQHRLRSLSCWGRWMWMWSWLLPGLYGEENAMIVWSRWYILVKVVKSTFLSPLCSFRFLSFLVTLCTSLETKSLTIFLILQSHSGIDRLSMNGLLRLRLRRTCRIRLSALSSNSRMDLEVLEPDKKSSYISWANTC